MAQGITLSLMIGPAVPVPVGRDVLEALETVRVTSPTEGPSGFQLTFKLDKRSPLHTIFLLTAGNPIPLLRVVIAVTVRGQSQVLIDGVMTEHQMSGGEDGRPRLTVTGEDLSRVMDYIDFSGIPYPGMPDFARVLLILAKYAGFGVIPKVIPSVLSDLPIPVERIPKQRGTDLRYVRCLASEVGYAFYLEPGPAPGTSFAYWGPLIKVGVPQPALNVDMDAHTNVRSLDFRFDSQARELPVLYIHNKLTKAPIPIPIPDITPLNPPLGAVAPIPHKLRSIDGTGKLSPVRAAAIGLAKAARSTDALFGSGSLDVLRYGRVLKPRQLVGVRGAGAAFDGLHYVDKVTHELQRGSYTQSFELRRNGILPTVPKVPV